MFDNGSVMCSCNHLTHFAILQSPGVEVCATMAIAKLNLFPIDSSSTSDSIDSDRTSVCVYLTGVPVGYYSDICTTKVSQKVDDKKIVQIFVYYNSANFSTSLYFKNQSHSH